MENYKPYFMEAPYDDLCGCVAIIHHNSVPDFVVAASIAQCGDKRIIQADCPLCDGTGIKPGRYV